MEVKGQLLRLPTLPPASSGPGAGAPCPVVSLDAVRAARPRAPAPAPRYEVVAGQDHVALRADGSTVDRFSAAAALALGEHFLAAAADLLWRDRGVLVVQRVSAQGQVLARSEATLVEHRKTAALLRYHAETGTEARWHDLGTGLATERAAYGWRLHPACSAILRGLRTG